MVKKIWVVIEKVNIEGRLLVVFLSIWFCGVLAGLPVNIPDVNSIVFTEKHYFRPIIIALLIQIGVGFAVKRSHEEKRTISLLTIMPFVIFSVFLHFNFKSWMPLINPLVYDHVYHYIDNKLYSIIDVFVFIREAVSIILPINVDFLYHHLFVLMFFISFTLHGLFDTQENVRKLTITVCLVLLLGGISYWLFPGEGAYLFRHGLNHESFKAQQYMHEMYMHVKNTRTLPSGYFVAAPAAMPSLHIAHSFVFSWFAYKKNRWLLLIYVPVTLWIIIESICSAWHYVADIPAGIILAVICIVMVQQLMKEEEKTRFKWITK